MAQKTVLITGANRGIGKALVAEMNSKSYNVIGTSRDGSTGWKLDTSAPESFENFAAQLRKKNIHIDVLINNAGIYMNGLEQSPSELAKTLSHTLQVNTIGPAALIQTFLPGMKEKNYGRIVNISSGMGQLSDMDAGYLAYRVSKTALNAVTKVFSHETRGYNILINTICPGWVRTDMGGSGATLAPEESAKDISWVAMLPDDGPNGKFIKHRKVISW